MNAVLVGIFAGLGSLATAVSVSASAGVVISQIQAGAPSATGASSQELVTIYNNSADPIDITNWCITNKSNTGTPFVAIGCFAPEFTNEKMLLAGKSHAVIASSMFVLEHPERVDIPRVSYDIVIPTTSGVITATNDRIGLYDANRFKLDEVTWTNLEGGKLLQRLAEPFDQTTLLDTGLDSDFMKTSALTIPSSGVMLVRNVIDLCTLEGVQETLPVDYGYDDEGNCVLLSSDLCHNITLVQSEIPTGLMADDEKGCYEDKCENIDGLQLNTPLGYVWENGLCTALESSIIVFSELLPNVSGSDTGREFIELHNPNAQEISLDGYRLEVGKNFEKLIVIEDISIPAMGYAVFYNTELGFTLLNTTSSVRLSAPAGNVVSEASYNDPSDDEAWAFIDGVWQYTNRPSPGTENEPTLIMSEEPEMEASVLLCPAGKYRHPITNRCRNIETDTSMLVACDGDEYRNPETNRCRKIASLAAVLAPCSEGAERNPETNRCRKVAGVSNTLTPCQDGYARNLETNRCRKISLPAVVGATAATSETNTGSTIQNTLIITAGLAAVGYGLYEWRSEFVRGARRIAQALSSK